MPLAKLKARQREQGNERDTQGDAQAEKLCPRLGNTHRRAEGARSVPASTAGQHRGSRRRKRWTRREKSSGWSSFWSVLTKDALGRTVTGCESRRVMDPRCFRKSHENLSSMPNGSSKLLEILEFQRVHYCLSCFLDEFRIRCGGEDLTPPKVVQHHIQARVQPCGSRVFLFWTFVLLGAVHVGPDFLGVSPCNFP